MPEALPPEHDFDRELPAPEASEGSDDEFVSLVLRYLDGATEPEEEQKLREELTARSDRRDVFVSLCRRSGELTEILAPERAVAKVEETETSKTGTRRSTRRGTRSIAIIRGARSRQVTRPTTLIWAAVAAAAAVIVAVIAVANRARIEAPAAPLGTEIVEVERPVESIVKKPEIKKPVTPVQPVRRVEPPPAPEVAFVRLQKPQGEMRVLGPGKASAIVRSDTKVLAGQSVASADNPAYFELENGCGVYLNVTTELGLELKENKSHLTLAKGQVFLDAPPGTRDMRIFAGGNEAVIQGTAFGMSLEGDVLRLMVEHGKVLVRAKDNEVLVTTGMQTSVSGGKASDPTPFRVIPPPAAWRWKAREDIERPFKPDPRRVKESVEKGVEYLSTNIKDHVNDFSWPESPKQNKDSLLLYAFTAAGADPGGAVYQDLVKKVLTTDLTTTYRTAATAMALQLADPVKYRAKIRRCAHYLVANQLKSGEWDYGEPVQYRAGQELARRDHGRKGGDNNNTHFAIMGLHACQLAGIDIPKETWESALKYFREAQRENGGWSYKKGDEKTYPAGTAGALAAVVICMHHLGQDWQFDSQVHAAVNYISQNFTLKNDKLGDEGEGVFEYYNMFVLSKASSLMNIEFWGHRDWYAEGAQWLFSQQGFDGNWISRHKYVHDYAWDGCFSMLFLQRPTQPLK